MVSSANSSFCSLVDRVDPTQLRLGDPELDAGRQLPKLAGEPARMRGPFNAAGPICASTSGAILTSSQRSRLISRLRSCIS